MSNIVYSTVNIMTKQFWLFFLHFCRLYRSCHLQLQAPLKYTHDTPW